jgi:hypothetical protein
MIPKAKAEQLIAIYLHICYMYEYRLKYCCERFSNNQHPEFTDQEVLTIYLFTMAHEQRFKVKQMHQFAKDYLTAWFPKLPSYVAFNNRLNRLSEAFRELSSELISANPMEVSAMDISVLDSFPIITCSGKRCSKVAQEITDKTFCSTKGIWYYGLKLHLLGFKQPNRLPLPEAVVLTEASENDLNVFKQNWSGISNRHFFGDKIYHDPSYFNQLLEERKSVMYTPVKGVKGQPEAIKYLDKAAADLYSTAVSRVRQPIESFFNWLEEKTGIQRASKVRSTNGLLVHVFGRLAVAFMCLFFNP